MSNYKPSVAVIVPAYNAAKSIGRTLDSILAQTWQNVQAWVVDDGSQDGTSAIVESYVKRDSRVHLLRQSNQGPYEARLNALKHIETDYFGFVDSDDYIDERMYETLLRCAEENDLDVASCSICGYSEDESSAILRGHEEIIERYVVPKLIEGRGNALVTDKIYRICCRPNNFVVLHSRSFEDVILNMQLFKLVKSYKHNPIGLYHYVVNPLSTTNVFHARELDDFEEIFDTRVRLAWELGCEQREESLYAWGVINLYNILRKASNLGNATVCQLLKNVKTVVRSNIANKIMASCNPCQSEIRRKMNCLLLARHFPILYASFSFARLVASRILLRIQ